ncbi:MAG: long-chain fatty acid--CoA ligase, partial [Acidimicrobiia bacterium]
AGGEAVHALGVLDTPVTEAELAAFVHERLAGYEVPRSFEFVTEIPRTASGKILKRELRRPWWEGRARRI